jgi:Flp pilus assembly protein TadD
MIRVSILLLACTLAAAAQKRLQTVPAVSSAAEAERLNTLGAAYMGMQDFAKALRLFTQAYATSPELYAARLNQGIALLNQQKYPAAREILLEAAERRPSDPRASYNLGLLYKATGDPNAALKAFQKAVALDPADADSRYFTGQMLLDLKQYDQAISELQKAIALDRFHASAYYALARAYQRSGQTDKSREHATRFQQLTRNNTATPLGIGYGQQGHYSFVQADMPQPQAAKQAIKVRFVDVSVSSGSSPSTRRVSNLKSGGSCVFDFDADGWPDVFMSNLAGKSALLRNVQGRFANVSRASGLSSGPASACAGGDFDNDGRTDLALTDTTGVRLLRNTPTRKFEDVTQTAGLRAKADSLIFADLDHDGDLDLYAAKSDGGELWRNNGNATFSRMEFPNATGSNAMAVDINNDNALDLIVADTVFFNQREGKFASSVDALNSETADTIIPLIAADFDRDGWLELVVQIEGQKPRLAENKKGAFSLADLPLANEAIHSAAVFDYDNDGWLDLAVLSNVGDGKLRVLRNVGANRFEDTSSAVGASLVKVGRDANLVAADVDNDGDPDLLIEQNDGRWTLLRNDGGNKNSWIKFALQGNVDSRSAFGTKLDVFSGGTYQKSDYNGPTGYLGQNQQPLLFGLGDSAMAERIRMRWLTGVVQDEAELSARRTHSIKEIDRRSSSCPLLFTWNGSRFEFISDVIGAGVIGHWVAENERNIPDPTEFIKIEASQLQPQNGRLQLRFLEPMEEVNYFDQARLFAIDHPADVSVHPNERFVSAPPFPAEKLIATRNATPPLGAWSDGGQNVLPALLARDRHYVSGFPLEKFTGFAKMHSLELEIQPVRVGTPLRLLLRGYTEYFTANSMYAASQAGLTAVAPYVEALGPDHKWTRVIDDMGFPAGLPRTMVADLTGKLPSGTTRIRIITNLQIYWDQVFVDTTPDGQDVRQTEAPIISAELRRFGYPKPVEGNSPGDLRYDYQTVSAHGPFATPKGAYTRLGDVKELVQRSDDQFVIFAPGEEIALEFDAQSLPPVPPGWKRDYFFFADGFVKDMDFYGADSFAVAPLPFHGMGSYPYSSAKNYPDDEDHLRYLLEYNDRFLFGEVSQRYGFNYNPDPQ